MRLATGLLLFVLLALSGCRAFSRQREEPKPDYQPAVPTREMRF